MKTEEVDLMYSMCSFDKAWRPKDLSPWCAVFNEDDLQVNGHPHFKIVDALFKKKFEKRY
jgi:hypothetical protein